MEVDGALCDAKLSGDLVIVHVAADALQDGEFALREWVVRAAECTSGGCARVDPSTLHGGADAVGECLARGLLVDEAVRARVLRPIEKCNLLHSRHENDAQVWKLLLEPCTDLNAARATLHADVHENEVGNKAYARLLCQLGEGAGADDLDVIEGGEDLDEAFEQYFLIVHEKNFNHPVFPLSVRRVQNVVCG